MVTMDDLDYLASLAQWLDDAPRRGAEKDELEGRCSIVALHIQISDALARMIAETLRGIVARGREP